MLFLSGCASSVKDETIAFHVSKDTNIDLKSIHYYSNALCTVVPMESTIGIWKRCALALTDKELLVYIIGTDNVDKEGDVKKADNAAMELTMDLRLKFSEMKGIQRFPYMNQQIQIVTSTGRLVLEITGKTRDDIDYDLSQNIYHFLLENEVPKLTENTWITHPDDEHADDGSAAKFAKGVGTLSLLIPVLLLVLFIPFFVVP
jgi:hypothetical protein